MKLKKLSLIASLGVLTLSIAACGGKSTSYNSTTPYGSLNLDSVVAQATDSTTNVIQVVAKIASTNLNFFLLDIIYSSCYQDFSYKS